MAQKIPKVEIQRLGQLMYTKSRLTNDYTTNTTDNQTAFLIQKFFGYDTKYLQTLNISLNLFNTVCSILDDYTGQPKTNITQEIDYNRVAYDMAWAGYAVLVCNVQDNIFKVDLAFPEGYIRDNDTQERLLFSYEVANEDSVDYYVLQKTYVTNTTSIQDDDGIITKQGSVTITSQLYRQETQGNLDNLTPVAMSTLEQTKDIPTSETMPIGVSPIVTIHNKKIESKDYGTSEWEKIASLVSSIEIQVVNIQDQFLKHLQAKLMIPRMAIPTKDKDGKKYVDVSQLEVVEIEDGQTFTPQYVKNTNDLMQYDFEYIDLLLTRLSVVSQIPKEILGIKAEGSSESEQTKQIRFSMFTKKIEFFRHQIEKGLKTIYNIRDQLGYGDNQDFICVWGDVLPQDLKTKIDFISIAREQRLMSRIKAIMQVQNISEDDAMEEARLIDAEEVDTGFELGNNPMIAEPQPTEPTVNA
jgi:hypothetical protein